MKQTNSLARKLLVGPVTQDANARRVLHAIWTCDGIPRIELAQVLGLDKSTITKIVAQLIETGIVREGAVGEAKPLGGRKPVELCIGRDFGRFLGIEIQTEKYHACLVDPLGEIESDFDVEISFKDRSLRSVMLDAIVDARGRLEGADGRAPLLGIGVGLSGIVDADRGILRRSTPLEVSEPVDLVGSTASLLSLPLRIENDARCCCWAELVRNRGAVCDDFMYILGEFRKEKADEQPGGIAIGMGLVIDGSVHSGTDGTAGEFRSVFRRSPTRSQFSLSDEVIRLAAADEESIRLVARELGANVGLLVNILDLRRIIIGGAFERWREVFAATLPEMIDANSPYPGEARYEVVFSALGESVVAYGAAAMLLSRLFAEPPSDKKSMVLVR
jgi:predicted NBD/HSP70 family sugar kinase